MNDEILTFEKTTKQADPANYEEGKNMKLDEAIKRYFEENFGSPRFCVASSP